jgi:hypothetical protein
VEWTAELFATTLAETQAAPQLRKAA